MQALLLTNAKAGFGDRRVALDSATVVLGQQPIPDPTAYELLIVQGGDGTLQRVMTDLLTRMPLQALPPIAVLPAGRTNMSAADINRHHRFRDCIATLRKLLDGPGATHHSPAPRVRKGASALFQPAPGDSPCPAVEARPMVQVAGTDATRLAWFFGIGALCSGIEYWNAERARGRLTANLRTAWSGLREFRRKGRRQRISLNGETHTLFAMIATTLNRLLFGSRPFWNAGAGLHNTWVSAEAKGLLRRSLRLLRGDAALGALPGYRSGDVTELGFELDGPYILDGELFHNNGPMRLTLSEPVRWQPL